MSNSRLEKFIYAICGMDIDDLPTPLSRIETLWNCLITGEVPDFEPLSRNEKYLMAMLNGDVDGLPEPTSRSEKLLYKITTGETDLSDVPGYLSRYEELLKQLVESGGIGGTDFEYVLYTLNQPLSTLYTTVEGPVKSAILKGQTLVNIAYIKQGLYNYTDYNLSFIDKTKTYFIKFNATFETNQIGFIVDNNEWNIHQIFTNPTTNGYVKIKPNESKEISAIRIRFNGNTDTSFIPTLDLICIEYQDGMENWDIPFFTGMKSVRMPVLTTTGKNLVSNMLPLNSSGGTVTTTTVVDNSSTIASLIEVGGNITLTVSKENKGSRFRYFMYRENPVNGKTMSIGGQYVDNRNTVTFTTQPDTKYLLVVWCGDKNIDYPINPQIEYGNQVTPYEPFKTNILTATSKNLFDMNRPYDNLTDSQATVTQSLDEITVSSAESGIYVNANFILDKDFFAGKTVTGSCLYESDEKDIGTVQIVYQDGDGEHHYQWIRTPTTFTFPNSFIGDVMLSVSANNTGTPQSNTVTVRNIQLELGSTATPYEPYSEVTLRGIGEVKDTLDGNTGELTQRIGEVVLDGSENWVKYGVYGYRFLSHSPKTVNKQSQLNNINTSIKDVSYKYWMDNLKTHTDDVICSSDSIIGVTLGNTKIDDVASFKQWLSKNPIRFLYILQENNVKTVDLSILDQDGQPTKLSTFNDITHVSIEAEDLLPTVDLEVPTKIEETLSTLPTLMNDILETQQLLNESIDDQSEDINEVSTAITEIRSDIL